MLLASGMALAESHPLRLGITPAMARGQYALLEEWRTYLQDKLETPVEFVFRDSYQESMDLMQQRKLDFAWFSSPAYIEYRKHIKLLVSPLYHGRPVDCSYLIVPSSDLNTRSLLNLKGKIFAYADPASDTGYLEPRHQLQHAKHDPDQFFKKTFFTRDHQKTVAAVAIGLADGGSMSGFAWETLALSRPDISSRTRVVSKSEEYGFPPLVARRTLNKKDFARMQQALLGMSADATGINLLQRLNINGFALAKEQLYHSTYLMMQHSGEP